MNGQKLARCWVLKAIRISESYIKRSIFKNSVLSYLKFLRLQNILQKGKYCFIN